MKRVFWAAYVCGILAFGLTLGLMLNDTPSMDDKIVLLMQAAIGLMVGACAYFTGWINGANYQEDKRVASEGSGSGGSDPDKDSEELPESGFGLIRSDNQRAKEPPMSGDVLLEVGDEALELRTMIGLRRTVVHPDGVAVYDCNLRSISTLLEVRRAERSYPFN